MIGRLLCGLALVAPVGCGSWLTRYRNADDQMVPRRAVLGAGLSASNVAFDESGLDANAAYVWGNRVKPDNPHFRYPHEGKRLVSFFRFWPSGHVAFNTAVMEPGEKLTAAHADDLQEAIVGRFAVPERGRVVIETLEPGNYAWVFMVAEGRIPTDGDVILNRQRPRGARRWETIKIYGNKTTFDQPLKYEPIW